MKLNLRITGTAEALIEDMCEQLGGISVRELILDSLSVYNHAIRNIPKGGKIGIQGPNGEFKEIITNNLEHLAAKEESLNM